MKPPVLSRYALCSLGRALRNARAFVGDDLDRPLREEIILHVSSLNSCAVCAVIHTVKAHRAGVSEGEIALAREADVEAWDPRTRAALRYAELRTRDREREFPDEVAVFEREFSPKERAAVRAVVDFFTFANRFNNTWERWLPGASGRRRRIGIEQ